MNRVFIVLLFFSVQLLPSQANAAEFQLKGRALGMGEAQACGQATITRHQELLKDAGVTGIDVPATGCEVILGSVAGIRISEPVPLLFWKGRLIRMVVRFGRLDWEEAGALHGAFNDLYGKPSIKRNGIFRTDNWRSGSTTLSLEWVGKLFPLDANAYLTDLNGWDEYQRVSEIASKAVNDLSRKRRSDDLRR